MRTRAVLAVAAVGALSLAAVPAQAAGKAQSASGKVTSGPASFVFDAKRAAGAAATKATGFFDGNITAGVRVLRFAGPINCLEVKGKSVGFYYPIDESDPALVARFGSGIQINLDTDGKGNATRFSFLPSNGRTVAACAPRQTVAPASGKVKLKS